MRQKLEHFLFKPFYVTLSPHDIVDLMVGLLV
jgi:hypothetical protein